MDRRTALLVLVLALAACSSGTPSATTPALETLERNVGRGAGPLVVLLHGYGSAPEHFLGLADRTDLPAGTLLVLPRAPLPIPDHDHGTMWWPLPDDLGRIPREHLPGVDEARARVTALLDRVAHDHPGRQMLLGGFSQGAMVSLDVALHERPRLAGLALLSGTFADEAGTSARLDALRGLPIYVSHGTSDDVLPYADDARLVEAMRAHGLDVSFTTFAGGHVVTDEVSTELAALITRVAASR